ncbi:catechol 2,3-dioxygenase [Pedobacter sp. CG_S7]|uniref:VOC family protein n=1 Tax=Pedobacter sp. CG_S7 TaxID=3143930 RepID=UPI0033998C89
MKEKYIVPTNTRLGHVHLKVADLDRSLGFYKDLLGLELTSTYGKQAAFLSADGYHHHIGLNTWHSTGSPPAPMKGVGLYHTAILYATRKELAKIYLRIKMAKYPMTGANDHGVSEALYLNKMNKLFLRLRRMFLHDF